MNKSENGLSSEDDSENCLSLISGIRDPIFASYLVNKEFYSSAGEPKVVS